MFISGNPGLSPFFWLNKDSGIRGIEHCLLFSHARGALRCYLDRLRQEREGKEWQILFPDYICSDLVRAAEAAAFTVNYYKINGNFEPDVEAVKEKITGKTLAVLVVHYFGFFSPVDDIVDLCSEKGIAVVEDCAHVLFDNLARTGEGLKGDASIFSLRKQFPIPDGGLLFVKDRKMKTGVLDRNKTGYPGLSKYFLKYVLSRTTVSPDRHYGRENYSAESFHGVKGISSISEAILKNYVGTELVKERRRSNFFYYVRRLTESGIHDKARILYHDLKESDVPYMFPLRLRHSNKELIMNLRRQGIPAISWPNLPEEVINSAQYAAAGVLQDRILLLPVHQDINNHHIDYVIHKLSQLI